MQNGELAFLKGLFVSFACLLFGLRPSHQNSLTVGGAEPCDGGVESHRKGHEHFDRVGFRIAKPARQFRDGETRANFDVDRRAHQRKGTAFALRCCDGTIAQSGERHAKCGGCH